MPKTVLVTVAQLREWRKRIHLTLFQCEATCAAKSGGICDCGNNAAWLSMEIALGQADRLKDWQPKVGDRVRLRAWPRVGPYIVRFVDTNCGGTAWLYDPAHHAVGSIGGRFFAELMPEEETK